MAKLEIATIAIQNLEGPSGKFSSVREVDRFRCVAGFTRHQLRDQSSMLFGARGYRTAVCCRELRFLTLER